MATENRNTDREIVLWLRFIEPKLVDASEAIVLGMGNGAHINSLSERYPNLAITVVDASLNGVTHLDPKGGLPIQYVNSIEGVETLQQAVRHRSKPLPILCFRPSWFPHKIFFQWVYHSLVEFEAPQQWKNSPSEFILESLFK